MSNPKQQYAHFMSPETLAAQQRLVAGYYQSLIQMYGMDIEYFRRDYSFFDPDGLLNEDGNVNWTYGYDNNHSFGNVVSSRGYIEMGNDAFIFSMIGADSEQDGKIFFTKEQFKLDFLDAVGKITTEQFETDFSLDVEGFGGSYNVTENYDPFSITFADDVDITDYMPVRIPGGYSDISEFSFVEAFDILSIDGITDTDNVSDVLFNPDGTIMYVEVFWETELYQYELSSPWEISTAVFANKTFTDTKFGANNDLISFRFNDVGTILYRLNAPEKTIHQYTLNTAWDISSADKVNKITFELDPLNNDNNGYDYEGLTISVDGAKIYVTYENILKEFTLSTPWDISTIQFSTNVDLVALMTIPPTEPYGIYKPNFNEDGTRLYIGLYDWDEGLAHQYSLSTPWDISSLTYDMSFDVSANVVSQYGLFTDPSSDNMFIIGEDNSNINRYYKEPGIIEGGGFVVDQPITLTVTDIQSNINDDICGTKSYVYNWIVQGDMSGTITGELDENGDGTLSVVANGDLTYNRSLTPEESNGWDIAPQSGDFFRLSFGDGTTEDFAVTTITDRDLNNDGISPFLGKMVWKCNFTRRDASHETVPSGYLEGETYENDYLNQMIEIQDNISDAVHDYDDDDDTDDSVYGGY